MPPLTTDPEFPFLTADQADDLRIQARDAFARHGVATVVHAPYLQSATHGTFPLKTLAQKCQQAGEQNWPRVIEEHVAALLSEPAELASDGLLECAFLRLLPTDFSPHPEHFRYVKPVAEGLVSAVALDLPDTVQILDDPDVERMGLGALRATARANLVNMPVEHHEVMQRVGGPAIHLVSGESMFVASKALVLAQLIGQVTGAEPPPDGVLVAVPWRGHLAFHPIVDGTVIAALNEMTGYALGAYRDNPGALSPRLYWWKDGTLTSITTIDDEARSIEPTPPPELVAIMRRLRG